VFCALGAGKLVTTSSPSNHLGALRLASSRERPARSYSSGFACQSETRAIGSRSVRNPHLFGVLWDPTTVRLSARSYPRGPLKLDHFSDGLGLYFSHGGGNSATDLLRGAA
jgi:hypothetical protein